MSHAEIKLSKGYTAIVDREDLPLLAPHKWHACVTGSHVYAGTFLDGKRVSMHRMLLSPARGQFVDHINNIGIDNRRSNIRVCTPAQNSANSIRRRRKHSGSRGVEALKNGSYMSRLVANGESVYLGVFSTDVEAAFAYNEAATRLHGEFAKLNLIDADALRVAVGARIERLKSELSQATAQLESLA